MPAPPCLTAGWSIPGDVVTATLDCSGKKYAAPAATARGDGYWVATLPPLQAAFGCTLALASANWTLNIAPAHVGDVFFCGGQSNMHLPLDYSYNGTQEAAGAASYSNLRLLQQETVSQSAVPLPDILAQVQAWTPPTPAIASGFSAVCWWFGRHLADQQRKAVPLGLIQGAWPSTYIRQLGPPEIGEACGVTAAERVDPCSGDSCKIFNSFMAPFQPGPFGLTGVVWLQ